MVAESRPPLMTVDEYLAMERESVERHEYVDGRVMLMAGGTINHGVLSLRFGGQLMVALDTGSCRPCSSDVRVQLSEHQYVYPDVSVTCDPRDQGDLDTIRFPVVIAEVLSPSTEAYDRGRKFDLNRECPTIQDYVLINSAYQQVEVYRRTPDDPWLFYVYGPEDVVELPSINVRIPVSTIYRGTDIPVEAPQDNAPAGI